MRDNNAVQGAIGRIEGNLRAARPISMPQPARFGAIEVTGRLHRGQRRSASPGIDLDDPSGGLGGRCGLSHGRRHGGIQRQQVRTPLSRHARHRAADPGPRHALRRCRQGDPGHRSRRAGNGRLKATRPNARTGCHEASAKQEADEQATSRFSGFRILLNCGGNSRNRNCATAWRWR